MKAIIGSVALQYYVGAKELGRKPGDVDYVATFDAMQEIHRSRQLVSCYPMSADKYFAKTVEGDIIETEIAWPNSNSEKLLKLIENDPKTIFDHSGMIPSIDVLYMLKMSHRYLKNSPHFLKTMGDIHMLRELGAVIRPEHQEFYEERQAIQYNYKHPNLNQNKKSFFTDDVPYTYDHDSIHEAIKVLERPAYSYFLADNSEVKVDKNKWDNLDRYIQLLAVYEESCVLALERSLIPYPDGKTTKEAFDMALMKVCTSITSGWFREFAWESYDEVQGVYYMLGDGLYQHKFYAALDRGEVKPFKR